MYLILGTCILLSTDTGKHPAGHDASYANADENMQDIDFPTSIARFRGGLPRHVSWDRARLGIHEQEDVHYAHCHPGALHLSMGQKEYLLVEDGLRRAGALEQPHSI
jgi:hypothetical protein